MIGLPLVPEEDIVNCSCQVSPFLTSMLSPGLKDLLFTLLIVCHAVSGEVPLFALLGIELTVFISVRAKGFREAQQVAGVLIIPILGLVMVNAFGISIFVFPWNLILLIGVGVADLLLYGVAVKKFGRENIISKI